MSPQIAFGLANIRKNIESLPKSEKKSNIPEVRHVMACTVKGFAEVTQRESHRVYFL